VKLEKFIHDKILEKKPFHAIHKNSSSRVIMIFELDQGQPIKHYSCYGDLILKNLNR